MEAQLKVNEKLVINVTAEDQKGLWKQLADLQAIFGESKCGKCGKNDLRYVVKTVVEDNEYYELRCLSCRAKLSFGQNKKGGGLFVKRKDGDNYLPHGGWMRWDSNKQMMV